MKAAVLYELNRPFVVEEIDEPIPHEREVLVKIVAAGLCHTDLSAANGTIPVPLPIVLGHEGAGIVEAVGERVTRLSPGDHVILTVFPYCGNCNYCLTGRQYLCQTAASTFFSGIMVDGSRRLKRKDGKELNHFFAQSSFAEFAVVHENTAVKIREDAPLDKVCILGCGASTGIGSVLNTARLQPGETLAVFGCGSVGLSGIMAAKVAGAGKIVAVDVVDKKLVLAKELGATHTVNSSKKDPVQEIKEITGLGTDYAVEYIGNTDVMAQAFDSTCPGGTTIIVGAGPFGSKLNIDNMTLLTPKTIMGCVEGSMRPQVDLPRYVEMFMDNKIPLGKIITHTFPLEEINEGFRLMKSGEMVKGVLIF
ncbi:MAG: Zn-dependent alcohol dehydrogenase [Pseudomonadota bacterium]